MTRGGRISLPFAWRPAVVAGLLNVIAGACGDGHDFEPPKRGDQVRAADALYSQELFDSVVWESDDERARVGNEVYARGCRNCHGTVGEGGTAYGAERGLRPPSLVEPEWRYAASLDSVRHRIFVGHELGMPTWGVAGISAREIDATAFYVLERLRPDVLGR